MADIRVGTSGYSFQDWKGTVYPSSLKNSEMFSHYIHQFRFNTLEINYTYYRPPTVNVMSSLAAKSHAGFDFTIKLFGGITHEPWKSSPPAPLDVTLCRQYIDGIRPIVDSGKLGCLLAQFPTSMRPGVESWEYLIRLRDEMAGLPLVCEFRNKEWVKYDTFTALREAGIGFCAVDEPQIGPLLPLTPEVTSSIGYLRLHGRSPYWFKDSSRRYDYLYSEEELREFVPVVHSMASQCDTIYIFYNNCHAGSAVRNARMMLSLLGIENAPVQGALLD